jgi:hypothetical protein
VSDVSPAQAAGSTQDALRARVAVALHDADCGDRHCEPTVMGEYYRLADIAIQIVAAAERERMAQLAEKHDVRWQPTAVCNRDCSRAPHPYPIGSPAPFADLIRAAAADGRDTTDGGEQQ